MSSKPSIHVENLSKSFEIGASVGQSSLREALGRRIRRPLHRPPTETFWALRDVGFEAHRGEAIGLIGANGAGKSTLLKILCRIMEPTTGEARLRGRVGSLLEVGTGFHPELTGRENIYLNGAILGMSRSDIRDRFDDIVDFGDIGRFLDTPVKRYSSGMYVRLAFAVAAFLQPEILLVDEVLAVGDAEFQRRCLGRMEDAARDEGRTILFVSHNLSAVEALCTRAIHLRSGHVEFSGPVPDAISSYLGYGGADQSGSTDLAVTGAPHFARIALVDGKGDVTGRISMGEPATITVALRDLVEPRSLHFGLHIRSGGALVAAVSSRMYPTMLSTSPRQQLRFAFPHVPLTPGGYTVDVGLKRQHEPGYLDFVSHALHFEVVARDVYGSGYLSSQADGVVYLEAEISSVPLDDELSTSAEDRSCESR